MVSQLNQTRIWVGVMRTLVEGVLVLDLVQEEGDLGGQVVEACAEGRERQLAPPSSGTTSQKASD